MPSVSIVFIFSDGSTEEVDVDTIGSLAKVIPLQHQIHDGIYRGGFRVRNTKNIIEIRVCINNIDPGVLIETFETEERDGDAVVSFSCAAIEMWTCEDIVVVFTDESGGDYKIGNIVMAGVSVDKGHRLAKGFFEYLQKSKTKLDVVEIGSRARSAVIRKAQFGAQNRYIGIDVKNGENVDIVGDVHSLSSFFPAASIDAVAGFSVFEHLAMPWKVAIELNKILKMGGRAMFHTHQTYPLHESPFDYWRFSNDTWPALFNRSTGFAVLDSACGEPARIRPEIQQMNSACFDRAYGYLSTFVLVEKISETKLEWDVPVSDVYKGVYPV